MTKLFALFASAICIALPNIRAADVFTQEELLQTAMRENQTIKAARARWDAAKERVPQARAWDDPMAGVDVERQGTTRFDKFTDNEWMVSQAVPLSGKNLVRGRTAIAEAQRAFEELRRVQLDIIARARAAYFRLANGYAQLEITRRNQDLLGQFTQISRAKYEAGLQTQTDVFLAQTDLARLSEARANFERDISEQESLLNVVMNRPARAPLGHPAPVTFKTLSLSPAQIEAAALAHRPEIVSGERRIEAEKNRVQLARRQWIPDPQFRVEARQLSGAGGGIQEYDTGVFINVPWVNFRKYSAGVREAEKNLEDAERQLGAAKVEVRGLVRDQLKRIATFAKNYELYRDQIVPLARQSIESARAGYESDKSGFLELITLRRTSQEAESAMLQYLADHQAAIAELEAIIGDAAPPDSQTRKLRK